jgi:chromosomal replication initiation ATPase DnaA
VVLAVCDFYQVSREVILVSRRGNKNLARDVSVYLVRHLCRITLPCVGREFGIKNYSTVSSIVQRVKSRIKSEKRLSKELNKIMKNVAKGQKRT